MTIQPPAGTPSDCVLGCGGYEVSVVRRGGIVTLGVLDHTRVEWGRVLEDASAATVRVDSSCCTDLLAGLRTWGHELLITRSGRTVWTGPITRLAYDPDALEITAWDVSGYLARRGVATTVDYTATGLGAADLTEIGRAVVQAAFAPEDPNVLPYLETTQTGVSGERMYTPDDVSYALDHLKELARTGLDFTTLGRRILLTGAEPTGQLATLTGDHFVGKPRVVEEGESTATAAVVVGTGVVGRAGGVDPFYGLVESRMREESILDQASADAAAEARVAAGTPTPLVIDPASATHLSPEAPVCINQLVPGVQVPVQITSEHVCRPVSTMMRVIKVQVTADSSGEQVRVELDPVGGGG